MSFFNFSPKINLDEYGFSCGEHYLKSDFSEDIGLNYEKWNLNFKNIISNAFKLVNERHSTKTRINQLMYMIDQIRNQNCYQHFFFRDGFLYQNNKKISKNFN